MSGLKIISGDKKDPHARFDERNAIQKTITSEIVIALCGPLGTPLHEVAGTFKNLLSGADYSYEEVEVIKLSSIIRQLGRFKESEEVSISALIEKGNQLRREHGNAVLAQMAIKQISIKRELRNDKSPASKQDDMFHGEGVGEPVLPAPVRRLCHIIDSIKNIDELNLLRAVYGEMLHVIGVYSPIEMRIAKLKERKKSDEEVHNLIDRDSGEEFGHGQRVEETFPLSDFFLRVDTETDSQRKARVERFLDLMLGTKIITPTEHERAMYAAFSAARNSACLSRQVGAAIADKEGKILATGWNDVPKAFGGLYETRDQNSSPDEDRRCWNIEGGKCFNDHEKNIISNAVVNKLIENKVVDEEARERAFEIIRRDTQLRSLIEFSRAVHAEMHAILNAGSSHGERIREGRLYVTTYPCHSCARHIVAAGIKEVYFLEPYRKSLATRLHSDAITEREDGIDKVRVMPFDGVAPSRFLKFFSSFEGGRKDKEGKMKAREAYPVTAITLEAIPTLESFAVRALESQGLLGRED